MTETVVAVVNMVVEHDRQANLRHTTELMREASSRGAHILVLPEACLQGYADFAFPLGSEAEVAQRQYFLSVAEAPDGPSLARIAQLCAELNLHVQVGFIERDASRAKLYNSVAILGPRGSVAVYRKCHNGFEFPYFAPGPHPSAVVDLGVARCGSIICYDLVFPEVIRGLALAGCNLALMSTAWPMTTHDRDTDYCGSRLDLAARANAFFNQMWMAVSDHCETGAYSTSLDYYGGGQIVGPSGDVVAAVGAGEGMVVHRADLDSQVTHARTSDFYGLTLLQDRRPELYPACNETSPMPDHRSSAGRNVLEMHH